VYVQDYAFFLPAFNRVRVFADHVNSMIKPIFCFHLAQTGQSSWVGSVFWPRKCTLSLQEKEALQANDFHPLHIVFDISL
jgi:hypothetical protein